MSSRIKSSLDKKNPPPPLNRKQKREDRNLRYSGFKI
jgi:hypothetical protein